MADIQIEAVDDPWFNEIQFLVHKFTIPAANCRPAKSINDQIAGPFLSECISKDACPPFVKNYRKYNTGYVIYERIPGIGIGCLMQQVSIKTLRRSAPSDAGNFSTYAALYVSITNFLNNIRAEWTLPEYMGPRIDPSTECP